MRWVSACAAGVVTLGLMAACSEESPRLPRRATALCGSSHTAEALKRIVIERAAARAGGAGAAALALLQSRASAVIEGPELAGYDSDTETVNCTGVLRIALPGGAAPGPEFSARVEFAAQPDPQGDGAQYSLAGAEAVITTLAQADPATWSARAAARPAAADALPASAAAATTDEQAQVADDAASVGDTARSTRSRE